MGSIVPRARLVHREKLTDEQGNILDLAIWEVPATPNFPEGVRYRLAFVRRGTVGPAVLYDNHAPKGHHRHVEGVEQAYAFIDLAHLRTDFMADVRRLTERDNG